MFLTILRTSDGIPQLFRAYRGDGVARERPGERVERFEEAIGPSACVTILTNVRHRGTRINGLTLKRFPRIRLRADGISAS